MMQNAENDEEFLHIGKCLWCRMQVVVWFLELQWISYKFSKVKFVSGYECNLGEFKIC